MFEGHLHLRVGQKAQRDGYLTELAMTALARLILQARRDLLASQQLQANGDFSEESVLWIHTWLTGRLDGDRYYRRSHPLA